MGAPMLFDRREALKLLALSAAATVIPGCTSDDISTISARVAAIGSEELARWTPQTLSPAEMQTLTRLVDYIIPADDRSGSASDAGVPVFVDFIITEYADEAAGVQAGLAWFDAQMQDQHGVSFVDATEAQQRALLDRVAYPDDASEEDAEGVSHFSRFRGLAATGFWSSKMGVDDLGYTGNQPMGTWEGCTPEAYDHVHRA